MKIIGSYLGSVRWLSLRCLRLVLQIRMYLKLQSFAVARWKQSNIMILALMTGVQISIKSLSSSFLIYQF